ncbi:MAG: Hsp70 family protein, partial [Anaerolineales bacterium]|nr:Hsp70 family protein [Anaerolineales bacterium]
PTVLRSNIYVTREHQILIGREAINTYYQQNSGRPRKLVKQYVGDLEQKYSDGLSVVEEIFARVDEKSPGRLIRSLKSELAGSYTGTSIFGRAYGLEELIALFLGEIRRRVQTETGQQVTGVVLGRPVHFVGHENKSAETDSRAQNRLLEAAKLAGFREVDFEFEPVAAALHYESTISQPQNIVVFDFGGGTLDVTVMRVGSPKERRIYAVGGVGIAGELFDRRIVEHLILDHLGQGSTWKDGEMPFPRRYTDAILNWQSILDLYEPETLHFFRQVQATSSHPARIRALESLVMNDEGIRLFDEVERAKIALSTDFYAFIRLTGEDIDIWQPVTRSQFENMIGKEKSLIHNCLLDTLDRSGLSIPEIDAVVRTGGSAQIPGFIRLLQQMFGSDKVVLSEVFSGVTAGLAIRAAWGDASVG